ncbi:MAG: arginine repressor [Candidatus Eisenbacteria bacterium]|uniref:Arginine repressor n=1 Tax=Eiseniibacteriota bacterium TaxID=2212470 RepID=A0A849SIN6_UNCEI|nr:arginine repressor [Candidatus Eisenbacteria bacterium]
MSRNRRITLLTQLLSDRRFSSQDELGRALTRAGIEVTQATLSRDLKSLRAIRRPDAEGRPIYELPGPAIEQLDRDRQRLDLRNFINDSRVAQNLLVVRTPPGHANAVGRAIDLHGWDDVIGTVAGDDTVLVIAADSAGARRLKKQLEKVASDSGSGK